MENFNNLWLKKVAANISKYTEVVLMNEVIKKPTPLEQTRVLLRLIKLNLSDKEIHQLILK
ncbi:MAG: hypothetical protein U9Q80_09960 [Bacillota bacterium]|nr:hypothetical protein [Bacillota bacterium]